MRELVLFYSYAGHTKKIAEAFAQESGSDVCEVIDIKRPNIFRALLLAGKHGTLPIEPLQISGEAVRFEDYGVVNVFAPIWNGQFAAAMRSAVELLPKGMKVRLSLVSGGGKSKKDAITAQMRKLSLEVIGYEDIKG